MSKAERTIAGLFEWLKPVPPSDAPAPSAAAAPIAPLLPLASEITASSPPTSAGQNVVSLFAAPVASAAASIPASAQAAAPPPSDSGQDIFALLDALQAAERMSSMTANATPQNATPQNATPQNATPQNVLPVPLHHPLPDGAEGDFGVESIATATDAFGSFGVVPDTALSPSESHGIHALPADGWLMSQLQYEAEPLRFAPAPAHSQASMIPSPDIAVREDASETTPAAPSSATPSSAAPSSAPMDDFGAEPTLSAAEVSPQGFDAMAFNPAASTPAMRNLPAQTEADAAGEAPMVDFELFFSEPAPATPEIMNFVPLETAVPATSGVAILALEEASAESAEAASSARRTEAKSLAMLNAMGSLANRAGQSSATLARRMGAQVRDQLAQAKEDFRQREAERRQQAAKLAAEAASQVAAHFASVPDLQMSSTFDALILQNGAFQDSAPQNAAILTGSQRIQPLPETPFSDASGFAIPGAVVPALASAASLALPAPPASTARAAGQPSQPHYSAESVESLLRLPEAEPQPTFGRRSSAGRPSARHSSARAHTASIPAAAGPEAFGMPVWLEEKLATHHRWVESGGAEGKRFRYAGENFTGISFAGADLAQAQFRAAPLAGMDFRAARLDGADFAEADLSRAILADAQAHRANFSRADLHFADLQHLSAQGANFSFADLQGARMKEADFTGANLREVNLQAAVAVDVVLAEANLRSARLFESMLPGADLRGADLRGALLERTVFTGADLAGASLKDARILDLDYAHTDFTVALDVPQPIQLEALGAERNKLNAARETLDARMHTLQTRERKLMVNLRVLEQKRHQDGQLERQENEVFESLGQHGAWLRRGSFWWGGVVAGLFALAGMAVSVTPIAAINLGALGMITAFGVFTATLAVLSFFRVWQVQRRLAQLLRHRDAMKAALAAQAAEELAQAEAEQASA